MNTFPRDPKAAALGASLLFEGLSSRQLRRMATCFDVARLAPGEALLREGTRADALWVIAEGEVELRARGRRLGRVGPGEVLGAAAMLARGEAELTAVAAGPVRVLVASHLQLNQLIACPEVERRLRAAPSEGGARALVSRAA
jgi:CRP-like cAMP-binding protein